jgi:hypothetical protein
MFYGSVGWNAPLFELRLKPGDHVALSRWRTTNRLIVNNIGYTALAFRRLQSDREAKQSWNPRDQIELSPADRLLYSFLSEEFTQDVTDIETYRYKLSTNIAEILFHDLHEDDKIDDVTRNGMTGIVYPAIALLGHADNLVLRPDIVDKYLQVEQVEYVRVDSMDVEGKYVTFHNTHLDFANSFGLNRSVEWKGRPARWNIVIPPGGKVTASKENGRLVYRDEAGNIIEPT